MFKFKKYLRIIVIVIFFRFIVALPVISFYFSDEINNLYQNLDNNNDNKKKYILNTSRM